MMTHDLPRLATAMTPFPYAVALDAPIDEAERLIAAHDIHHLPVTDEHEIVGIVTSHDLVESRSGKRRRHDLRVDDVCVKDVYVVDLHQPLASVVSTMADRHVSSAIVTRQGRLAGVFTWVDACRCLATLLGAGTPSEGGDDAA
ncbi:MAG: CBS domain-containing protein [Alphaproteobacteria bacterium]